MNAYLTSVPLSGLSALVVEPKEGDRSFLVSTLKSAGLVVTAEDGFPGAHARLVRRPPAVLVTEIRLGYHNGLHLAHVGRWMRQRMILVVTSRYHDPVLTRDAEALGATFVQKPLTVDDLLATLYRAARPERPTDALMIGSLPPLAG